jgi:hypothetical protein
MKTTHRITLTDDYIAEAQRLAIAQNNVLKWLYQSWWIQWVARIILVGFITYSLLNHMPSSAAMFGFFLVFSLFGEWFGRRGLAKARRNVRAKGTTTTISMSEAGIDMDGALGNSHLKWAAMLTPVILDNGVLIKTSRTAIIWLPDQTLVEGSPSDVRCLLSENVDKTPDKRT